MKIVNFLGIQPSHNEFPVVESSKMRESDFDMIFQLGPVQYKTAVRLAQSVDQLVRNRGQPVHRKLDMKVDYQNIQNLDSFCFIFSLMKCVKIKLLNNESDKRVINYELSEPHCQGHTDANTDG